MKGLKFVGCLAMLVGAITMTSCGSDEGKLLELSFDEGSGSVVKDNTKKHEDAKINYLFDNAIYTKNKEPEWRKSGVKGGAFLFDGNSNYISYEPNDICLSGSTLSIGVWVAPRAFEWDDPNAKNMGTQQLTAIISQYNKKKGAGVLLGYERYGQLCLEIGAEDRWHTLWSKECLSKDEWNYVLATYNATEGKITLALNGAVVAEDKIDNNATILPAEKEKLLIGKNSKADALAAGTYNMFSGLMDELVISEKPIDGEKYYSSVEHKDIAYEDIGLVNILGDDIYKTQYHGGPYQHWMNEPHAPFYYNGKYHLFFQQNMVGTYWRNIQWGHLVSDDMVSWTPVKEAICPTKDTVVPDGVWSGNTCYDKNGVPLLFFTAGNDSFKKEGLISNQNIGVAYPMDLEDNNLIDWTIYDELAVKQNAGCGRAGEFRDPYIWKEGDTWCMLVCSGSAKTDGGSALLYTTDTLELKDDGSIDMDWQYKGPIYEMENQSITYGTSWELPILMPVSSKSGDVSKYAFMISPAPAAVADNKVYYFIGDFDLKSGKFIPDEEYDNKPGLLDYGDNVFTGPSAFVDPNSGDICMFSIMQDKRNGAEEGAAGWAHCVGLTRVLSLSDDGKELCIKPLEQIAKLEDKVLYEADGPMSVAAANEAIGDVKSDMLHLKITFEAAAEDLFGVTVKTNGADAWTKYWYESGEIHGETSDRGSEGKPGPQAGKINYEGGLFTMEVYVDRSLVEGYFNDSKAISIRSYSDYDAQGIEILGGDKVNIKSIYISSMGGIYEREETP